MKEEVRVDLVYSSKNGTNEIAVIDEQFFTTREAVEFARLLRDNVPELAGKAREIVAKEQKDDAGKRLEYQQGHYAGYVEGIRDERRRAK